MVYILDILYVFSILNQIFPTWNEEMFYKGNQY